MTRRVKLHDVAVKLCQRLDLVVYFPNRIFVPPFSSFGKLLYGRDIVLYGASVDLETALTNDTRLLIACKNVSEKQEPVVLVLASENARAMCKQHGLLVKELLMPFRHLRGVNVSVRTTGDNSNRIDELSLRFLEPAEMSPLSAYEAEERVKNFLDEIGPSARESSGRLRQMAENPEDVVPSWLRKWRNIHRQVLQYEDTEGTDHGLGSFFVLTSKDEVTEESVLAMISNPENQPWTMKSQAANPQTIKFFIVLHDCEGNSAKVAEGPSKSALQYLSSKYGAEACQLLPINIDQKSASPSPWDELYEQKNIALKALSHFQADILSTTLEKYVTKVFLPQIERRIRHLHQQVATTRKGLMNQMRNKLWRRDKDKDRQTRQVEVVSASTPASSAEVNGGVPIAEYTYDTPESQMRNLGDLTYLLRDFDAAAASYRILITDLKSDKTRENLASAYECLGNSLIGNAEIVINNRWRLNQLTSAYKKEVESVMMEAIDFYKKSGKIWQASRVACTLAQWHSRRMHHKDAVRSFRIASDKTPHVIAGPALELASHAAIHIRPLPSVRRASFDMILAGFRYSQVSLRMHAMRAYLSVTNEYDKKEWVHINDHICSSIGRQSAHLGQYSNALPWFIKLLESTRQPANMQKGYLQVPAVDAFSIQAEFEDWRTFSSFSVVTDNRGESEPLVHIDPKYLQSGLMESGLIPSEMIQIMNSVSSNWLNAASNTLSDRLKVPTIGKVAAEEWVQIRFTLFNSLEVAVKLSNLRLNCSLVSSTETPASDSEDVEVLELQCLVLERKEKRSVCLSARCRRPGKLIIKAVLWTLDQNILVDYQLTNIDNLKRHHQEKRSRTTLPIRERLVFEVVSFMPKLAVEEDSNGIHQPSEPSKIKQGELRHMKTKVRNSGKLPLKNLRMKLPKTFLLQSSPNGSLWEEITQIDLQGVRKKDHETCQLYEYKQEKIGCGESVELDLVFYCPDSHITPVDEVVFLYFEPFVDTKHAMPFRILCLRWNIEVIIGPTLACCQYPNFANLQQSILRIDFRSSKDESESNSSEKPCSLYILSKSSNGMNWSSVVPLEGEVNSKKGTLNRNLGESIYFRIVEHKFSDDEMSQLPWVLLKKIVMSRSTLDSTPMLGLYWKHADKDIDGMCVLPTRSVIGDHPIRLRIAVDEQWVLANSVCKIPVRFFVFNATSMRARVCLNVRKNERSASKVSYRTSNWVAKNRDTEERSRLETIPQREYFWSGISQHRCDNLAPFHETSFGCTLVATCPGNIELRDFSVYYELLSNDKIQDPILKGSFTGKNFIGFQAPVIVVRKDLNVGVSLENNVEVNPGQ